MTSANTFKEGSVVTIPKVSKISSASSHGYKDGDSVIVTNSFCDSFITVQKERCINLTIFASEFKYLKKLSESEPYKKHITSTDNHLKSQLKDFY